MILMRRGVTANPHFPTLNERTLAGARSSVVVVKGKGAMGRAKAELGQHEGGG